MLDQSDFTHTDVRDFGRVASSLFSYRPLYAPPSSPVAAKKYRVEKHLKWVCGKLRLPYTRVHTYPGRFINACAIRSHGDPWIGITELGTDMLIGEELVSVSMHELGHHVDGLNEDPVHPLRKLERLNPWKLLRQGYRHARRIRNKRRREYSADRFAAILGHGHGLITSLRYMEKMQPVPWRMRFWRGYPSYARRIRHIETIERYLNKARESAPNPTQ